MFQERFQFLLVHVHDGLRESRIHIEAFAFCLGVRAHDGMFNFGILTIERLDLLFAKTPLSHGLSEMREVMHGDLAVNLPLHLSQSAPS